MAWIVEDGKRIEDVLSPFYATGELWAGKRVRVWKNNRRLAPATIERAHCCWHDYKPVGFEDPNGHRWEQCAADYSGNITAYMWTLTDDDQPVAKGCNSAGTCVHVCYKNGHRAVVDLCYIRPPDVLGELAAI